MQLVQLAGPTSQLGLATLNVLRCAQNTDSPQLGKTT